ncbi:MAG: hypothetical protein IT463_10985 [Planctomycetes bacterium]|nr:hypothetical protein [Planctomycetota bacterium]
MLGSMKGQARVAYAKSKRAPARITGAYDEGGTAANTAELKGQYYEIEDRVFDLGAGNAALLVHPLGEEEGWGVHVFSWQGGDGTFVWLESEDEALEHIAKETQAANSP